VSSPEPFNIDRLPTRLAGILSNAGLTEPSLQLRGVQFVNLEKLSAMSERDLLRVKGLGRQWLEELRRHGLVASAPGAVAVSPDLERMAAIGHAVVVHLTGDDPRALREATAELVVGRLQRQKDEAHSIATSKALRVGRLVLGLVDELTRE
jgi:hypothetical protein